MMVTVALTQALTVGTTTLVAHAIGGRNLAEARRIFNQSQALATGVGLAFVAGMFALRGQFAAALAADAATVQALNDYLNWFLPAMGVQFLLVAIGAALRGAGEVRAPMLVQLVAVVVNTILAPVLIAGWGTSHPLGVAGAGLATFIAVVVGALLLLFWVRRQHDVLQLEPQHWRPDFALWRRMLAIGLPAGGEFLLMSVYATVIYAVIRDFGAETQAGFGVGMRVLQTGFMPGLAVAFSVSPIAAQNFGAGNFGRVREALRAGLIWVSIIMIMFMLLCHTVPEALIGPFSSNAKVVAVGSELLGTLSFNFLASGVILVASGMFQALGNTVPSLMASASRIALFAIPAFWIARWPGFQLVHLWWLSVASVILQMVAALLLLRREFRRRLPVQANAPAPEPA
jgi:putative MATE family efflux protein